MGEVAMALILRMQEIVVLGVVCQECCNSLRAPDKEIMKLNTSGKLKKNLKKLMNSKFWMKMIKQH